MSEKYKSRIVKSGNSFAIKIPYPVKKRMQIEVGDEIDLILEKKTVLAVKAEDPQDGRISTAARILADLIDQQGKDEENEEAAEEELV